MVGPEMLLDHQKRAKEEILSKLNSLQVSILEGETRCGKTLTALSVAKALGGDFLVLTTKKALEGWKKDWEALGGGGSMSLINYHSSHKMMGSVPVNGWSLVILDECHSSGLSSYPKQGKVWKAVAALVVTGERFLLMSGTVAIESKAQLWAELAVTGLGPWSKYRDFYSWWRQPGHYKDGRSCGGYGVEGATKSVGGAGPSWSGGEVTDYSQVDDERIKDEIYPYVVSMEREGFAVKHATLIPVELKNPFIVKLIKTIKRDKLVEVEDSKGETRLCVYDKGAAAVAQACHMVAGGTLKDVDGESFVLGGRYCPRYRINWIVQGIKGNGKKYAIHTAYIHERDFVRSVLIESGVEVHFTLEDLKASSGGAWVGSLESFAEGVDMSWLDGSQILYSLVWKGSKFSQVCDRQLRYDRKEVAKVAIPLLYGGIDKYVFEAVSNKRNFNGKI